MSDRELSLNIAAMLGEIRSAGRGASRSVLEKIIDRFLPGLIQASDLHADLQMSQGSRERGWAAIAARIEQRRTAEAAALEPISTIRPGIANRFPIGAGRGDRRWFWGFGMAGAAVLLLMGWLLYSSLSKPVIVKHEPKSGTSVPIPNLPEKRPEGPMVSGPKTDVRSSPVPTPKKQETLLAAKQPEVGKLGAVMGEPLIYAAGSKKGMVARPGMTVARGATVETGDADKLELKFTDGTTLRLDFNTRIQIPASTATDRSLLASGTRPIPRPQSVTLEEGRLYAMVTHREDGEHFRVETAAATAEVLGTSFELGLDKSRADSKLKATLKVTEGRVAFYNALGRVEAGKRMQTEALEGNRPSEPQRIVSHRVFILPKEERFEAASFPLDHAGAIRKLVYPLSTIGIEVSGTPEGTVYVGAVRPGSPAHSVGVRSGSIVLAMNGRPVSDDTLLRGSMAEGAVQHIRLRTIWNNRVREHTLVTESDRTPTGHVSQLAPQEVMATRYVLFGKYAEAKSRLLQLSHAKPSAAVLNNLGVVYEALDDLGPAIRCYAKAVQAAPAQSRFRSNLGHALKAIGNLPRAIEELQEAVRLNPAYGEAREDLAEALSFQARHREGLAVLSSAPPSDPLTRAQLKIRESWLHLRMGNLPLAEEACRDAITLMPEFSDAWTQLTWVHYLKRSTDEALAAGRKAIALNPGSGYAWDAYGAPLRHLDWITNEWREEKQVYLRALQMVPWDSIPIASFCDTLRHHRQFREYQRLLQGAIKRGIAGISTYAYLLNLAIDYGSIEEAEQLYREASARWPDDPDLRSSMGYALMGDGRYAEAEPVLRESIELDPSHIAGYVCLIELCLQTKRLKEAEQLCRDLLGNYQMKDAPTEEEAAALILASRKGDSPSIYRYFFYAPNGVPEAVSSYRNRLAEANAARAAFSGDPNSEDTLLNFATSLRNLGREKEAAEACKSFMDRRGFSPRIAVMAAKCLLDVEGSEDEALSMARRAENVRIDPSIHSESYRTLILVHLRRGEVDMAKALFGRVHPRWTESAEQSWSLADILVASGRVEEGFSLYRKAAALDPTPTYTVKLAELFVSRALYRMASDLIFKAWAAHPNDSKWMVQLFAPYSRCGDIGDVLEMGRKALAVKPNDPDLQVAMGRVLKDNGDLAGAIRMFQESIRNPAMPPGPGLIEQPWSELAVIYEGQGKLSLAIAAFREVLRHQPKNVWAQGRLNDLLKKVSLQR